VSSHSEYISLSSVQQAGFDASEILADGNFAGTQCLLYSSVIPQSEAYNAGQWGSDGRWYSFQPSVFYTKNESPILIDDGGFENSPASSVSGGTDYGPWFSNDGLVFTSNYAPHSGNYGAMFGSVGHTGSLTYTEPIPSRVGNQYTLTFWLANGSYNQYNSFVVTWNGVNVYTETNQNAFAYKQVSVTVTAAASNTLVFTSRQDPSYYFLDDISFATVQ
jgi:hypothetical protein